MQIEPELTFVCSNADSELIEQLCVPVNLLEGFALVIVNTSVKETDYAKAI